MVTNTILSLGMKTFTSFTPVNPSMSVLRIASSSTLGNKLKDDSGMISMFCDFVNKLMGEGGDKGGMLEEELGGKVVGMVGGGVK